MENLPNGKNNAIELSPLHIKTTRATRNHSVNDHRAKHGGTYSGDPARAASCGIVGVVARSMAERTDGSGDRLWPPVTIRTGIVNEPTKTYLFGERARQRPLQTSRFGAVSGLP